MARNAKGDTTVGRIAFYVLTRFRWFWNFAAKVPWLRRKINAFLVNSAIETTKPRPYPLSLMAEYTSWASLTDRTYSSRHLPPAPRSYTDSLPALDKVAALFKREKERESAKSTVWFANFAQWFTDGFLKTGRPLPGTGQVDPKTGNIIPGTETLDYRRNMSNHDIDLSELYGLNIAQTAALRSNQGGMLKSQMLEDGEYPPFYLGEDGEPKPEFQALGMLIAPETPPEHRKMLFAMGGQRANVQIGFVAMNVLFLREHNRICRELAKAHPDWDDDRLFATARCILTVMLMRIVIEEYISHISPFIFNFVADPTPFNRVDWYRTNWMAIEFSLLYRWHGLVPSEYKIKGDSMPSSDALFNNQLLLEYGLGNWIDAWSRQPSGDIGLYNTPDFIMEAEKASLRIAREVNLRSYNDYRVCFGSPPVTSFDEISGDPKIIKALHDVYDGDVDKVELYVGLFAEDVQKGGTLPPLMGGMVSVDAFSQAFTNPLLAPNIYNSTTLSYVGMKMIQDTPKLQCIVDRNIDAKPGTYLSTFTRTDFVYPR